MGFFRDLTARGPTGVRLVTSGAHCGLVEAIVATLPRCVLATVQNPLRREPVAATPKTSLPWGRAVLHLVYDQPDAGSVHVRFDRVLGAVADKLPKVAEHLDPARADVLAFTGFSKEIWRQSGQTTPPSGSTG